MNNLENVLKEVLRGVRNMEERFDDLEGQFNRLREDFDKYEDNYRPTHKNKININSYIKERLGGSLEVGEVDKVKDRALMMFEADSWQEIPVRELVSPRGMAIIDDSILSTIHFRSKEQTSLFGSESTLIGEIKYPKL